MNFLSNKNLPLSQCLSNANNIGKYWMSKWSFVFFYLDRFSVFFSFSPDNTVRILKCFNCRLSSKAEERNRNWNAPAIFSSFIPMNELGVKVSMDPFLFAELSDSMFLEWFQSRCWYFDANQNIVGEQNWMAHPNESTPIATHIIHLRLFPYRWLYI